MLPETHHQLDEKWLTEKFNELIGITGINHAKAVADRYSIVYADTFEKETLGHKKHNKARHEANQRLVKLFKSLAAKPIQPTA
jgi:hypothetical protein